MHRCIEQSRAASSHRDRCGWLPCCAALRELDLGGNFGVTDAGLGALAKVLAARGALPKLERLQV